VTSAKWRQQCGFLALAALSSLLGTAGRAKPAAGAAFNVAETALAKMQADEWREAMRQTKLAIKQTPDDPTINVLSAAILMHTGDANAALPFLKTANASAPDDSLANYALGLAQLARGDRAGALQLFDRSERNGGDKTRLLVARRYAQWIGGALVSVGGAGLPAELLPAQRALDAMNALRQGNRKQAIEEMQTALNALPGDPIVQNEGLLMSFDAARPLTSGASALPAEKKTAPAGEAALRGSVTLSPNELPTATAYVSYSVDGQALGLVSSQPFAYDWNSRRVSNGWHELTVTFFDRQAVEINHTTRRLRVLNTGGDGEVDRDQQERVRAALWQELTLRPARCQCTYLLASLYRAAGDVRAARDGFARVAALNANYRDVRAQLTACGGMGEAKAAVFGGLPTERVIALTFDDGPKPGLTEPLLEMLTNARVPATFFVIGKHVMEYPELTRRITDAGMEIANHSYTHRNLTTLTSEQVAQEMLQTQAAIMSVTGKMPRFMRPPGGNWNSAVAQVVQKWGLTPCMWTVDVYGSEVLGAQQVANAVLREVRPGSIILMHNGKVSTLQALPTILRELKARGYSFTTVEALARRRSAVQQAGQTSGGILHRGE
jgi:peptidoglycan/xylan/chitin deacetylase (PgdA/CDA1 family)